MPMSGGLADTLDVVSTRPLDALHKCIDPVSFWSNKHVTTSAWLEHGPFAFWLINAIRPRILVELGTHNGFSYLTFCQAVHQLGLGTACYAVDTWVGDDHAGFYGEDVWTSVSRVNDAYYRGFSTLIRDLFAEALPYFGEGTIDLLHIDGRHSYEDVASDFRSWRSKLSERAVVLFHDTNVREREFGVWRLWRELSRNHPSFEFIHGHGLGVLALGPETPAALRPLLSASVEERAAIQSAYARLGSAVSWQHKHELAVARSETQLADARGLTDACRADYQALAAQQAASILAQETTNRELQIAGERIDDLETVLRESQAALAETAKRAEAHRHDRDLAVAKATSDQAASARALSELGMAQKLAVDTIRLTRERTEQFVAEASARAQNLESMLAKARRDIQEREAHLLAATRRLGEVEASLAWRATGPLRQIGAKLPRSVRTTIRRAARLMWWTMSFQLHTRLRQRKAVLAAIAAQVAAASPEPQVIPGPSAEMKVLPAVAGSSATSMVRVEAIDIVICVHNALDSTKACLESVIRCTLPPYRLIIVDDGSDILTSSYIDEQAAAQGLVVIRNAKAVGYTRAANIGLRAVLSPWVVLLNSDTVVTPLWLDRMWAHGARDPLIGVIGPLSNTASWQSVPRIFEGDDWADNPLPPGVTIDDMAHLVSRQGGGVVFLPFINGFCYMIRGEVLKSVGLFDEDSFDAGYGEENDYSIRVRRAGWSLAVATDTYVYHAQSKSYSQERRLKLAKQADEILARKHDPRAEIWPQARSCRNSLMMASVRSRLEGALRQRRLVKKGREQFEGKRVAFILPIAERGGGGNVILQESRALQRMGVDVTILNLDHLNQALGFVPEMQSLQIRTFPSTEALTAHLIAESYRYDAVVATLYRSVYWLREIPDLRLGYYVQDFEPYFFPEESPEHRTAMETYARFPEIRLLTKTRWNQMEMGRHVQRKVALLGPSVDVSSFSPGVPRRAEEPVRIVAMVRLSTPRRAPERTLSVLGTVVAKLGDRVSVTLFGSHDRDLEAAGLQRDWAKNLGHVNQLALARLLSSSDIFLDCSDYQAMGLTALEAMLSGCAVVAPLQGGTNDFIRSGKNGLLVDTSDENACVEAVVTLVNDAALLEMLRMNAVEDANVHIPERAALRLMCALFDD